MRRKVKISDIAQRSGVSLSTVSLALNNKPGVSEETRQRVLEVADELAYPVKPPSSIEKSERLTTVGMVVKIDANFPPQANPFYSKVIVGIEDVCRRYGINLLFASLPVDERNRPVEVPQMLYNNMLNGLLMVGTLLDESFTSIYDKQTTPIVLVDGYSIPERFDAIISDNFKAAYQAVSHLIQKGHRHIGLIGGDESCYPSLKDRRNGYLRALKENGIHEVYPADFNINKTHGYQETISLLNEHPHITALFCINDNVGNAALKAAQSLGKHVPEDISIIGYDDTYIAANANPALTTMHVDTVTMGRAAVHLLSLRVDNPESAHMTLTVHPWLVERESVAQVPSSPRQAASRSSW